MASASVNQEKPSNQSINLEFKGAIEAALKDLPPEAAIGVRQAASDALEEAEEAAYRRLQKEGFLGELRRIRS